MVASIERMTRPFARFPKKNASPISLAYRLMGGRPKPLVRRAFQLTSFNKLVTKPFVPETVRVAVSQALLFT